MQWPDSSVAPSFAILSILLEFLLSSKHQEIACSCKKFKSGWQWKGPDGAVEDQAMTTVLSERVQFGKQNPSWIIQVREYDVRELHTKALKE